MATEVHFSINRRKLRDGIRKAVRDSITSKTKVAMGLSEKNLTAEAEYGYRSTKPKPKNMAKPIIVEIKKTRHEGKQKFTYKIDKPGKGGKITKLERYASASNARRAAAKELNFYYDTTSKTWINGAGDRDLVFVNK